MEECYVVFAYDDYRKEVGQQILAVLRSEEAAKSLIAPLVHPSCQGQHQYVNIEGDVFDQEIIPTDYATFYQWLLEYYEYRKEMKHGNLTEEEIKGYYKDPKEYDAPLWLGKEELAKRSKEHTAKMEKIKEDLGLKRWYHRIGISKTRLM